MGSELPSGERAGEDLARRRREAQRPLDESGEGESEGFELTERDLIEHASHGDQHNTTPIFRDSRTPADEDGAPDRDRYGEADDAERP